MDNVTPRELLSKFYLDNNLDADGGQSSSTVKIELSQKIHFYFPNFNARRKAVIKHDIHHLLTGYTTSVSGESEISAWEIGSGCKKYWAAFVIDTSGILLGIPFNFWNTLKAFARGRRTRNLYYDMVSTENAIDMKITELRTLLFLDKQPKNVSPTITDHVLFLLFIFYGIIHSVLMLPLLPIAIFYSIYVEFWVNRKH